MGHPISPLSGRGGTAGRIPAEREEKGSRSPARGAAGTLFLCSPAPWSCISFSSPSGPLSVRGAADRQKLQGSFSSSEQRGIHQDLRGCGQRSETIGWLVDRTRAAASLYPTSISTGKAISRDGFSRSGRERRGKKGHPVHGGALRRPD